MILLNLFLAILLKNFEEKREEKKGEEKEGRRFSFYIGLIKEKIAYWFILCFGKAIKEEDEKVVGPHDEL